MTPVLIGVLILAPSPVYFSIFCKDKAICRDCGQYSISYNNFFAKKEVNMPINVWNFEALTSQAATALLCRMDKYGIGWINDLK